MIILLYENYQNSTCHTTLQINKPNNLFRNVYEQKQIQKDLQSVKTELQYIVIFGNTPQYDMFKMKRC